MSTPAVRIPITSEDLSGPGFASAQAKVQSFQQTANYSMRDARASAKLLSDELGVNLNRHLITAIASSQALGAALSAAFGVAVGVAFLGVAIDQGKKLYDLLTDADFKAKHFDEENKIAGQITKALEEAKKLDRELQLAEAPNAGARRQLEIQFKMADVDEAKLPIESLNKELDKLQAKLNLMNTNPWFRSPREIDETTIKIKDLQMKIADATIAQQNKGTEAEIAKVNAAKEYNKELDSAQKKLEHLQQYAWNQVKGGQLNTIPATDQGMLDKELLPDINAPDWIAKLSTAQTNPLYSGSGSAMDLAKIQTDQNAAIQAAQQIYEQTRTKAQVYSDSIATLTELLDQGRISQDQFNTAAMQAASQLDNNSKAWKQLNSEIVDQMLNAAFMKESWSNAIKSILEDIAKLIIKMYLLDSISKALKIGGSGGGGGGGLVQGITDAAGYGLFGLASGGYANAGMSYLVGERGPELFTPGSSGSISPSGSFGRQAVYNIDARGADVSVERRIMSLLPIIEERAVIRAMNGTQERSLRR